MPANFASARWNGVADRRGRRSLQCIFGGAAERTVGDAGPYNAFRGCGGRLGCGAIYNL